MAGAPTPSPARAGARARVRWTRALFALGASALINVLLVVASVALIPDRTLPTIEPTAADVEWIERSVPARVRATVGGPAHLRVGVAGLMRQHWLAVELEVASLWLVDGDGRPQLEYMGMSLVRIRGGLPVAWVEGAYWRPNPQLDWDAVHAWPPSPTGAS